MKARYDVAIIGFGPSGATLAALLGRRGVSVIAIDAELDVFPLPRAAHIDHTGLRTLQELGCLDALLPEMLPNVGLDFLAADRSLLVRIPADQANVSDLPTSVYFHQPEFDRALRSLAEGLPTVDVRLGQRLVGLSDDGERVELELETPDGLDTITASWVVGCDGASSTVRELVGVELDDLGSEDQFLVVDLILRKPVPTLPTHAVVLCDPARPAFAIPIPNHRYRFELMLLPGEDPNVVGDPSFVFEQLRDWLPPDAAEVERAAVYVFHALVAKEWRVGRVLLAGDAAHQMPPFLGQGMCSGLRDATNLAWKLALVVSAGADAALLDTYRAERDPHVRSIVQAAVDFGAIICELDPDLASQRDRRYLDHALPATERQAFRLPSLPPGPLVLDGGGDLFPQPVVRGGMRLDELVGDRFLVIARDQASLAGLSSWWADELGALVTTLPDLGIGEAAMRPWFDRRQIDVAVVRPDRYTLAAGATLDVVPSSLRDLLDPAAVGGVDA